MWPINDNINCIKQLLTIYCIVITLVFSSELPASQRAKSTKCEGKHEKEQIESTDTTPGQALVKSSMNLYRRFISSIDDKRCKMYPSCSNFASQSTDKYGFLSGIVRTVDRLHRCGHDLSYYQVVAVNDTLLYLDAP